MSRIDRANYGPSWTEVILGAFLSLVLGVLLGAVLLVLRPVTVAKELPKEPVSGVVYYIEGSKEPGKARQAPAKRAAFVQGQSVTLSEDELNALASSGSTPPGTPPAKAADKKGAEKGKDQPAEGDLLATGAVNFRIADGALQVGVPVTVNVLGLSQKVVAHARGGFVKKGDMFVYEPDVFYVGSCPLQRLPFVGALVRDKFILSQPIPEDIKASWMKLSNVAIDGRALKLTMP